LQEGLHPFYKESIGERGNERSRGERKRRVSGKNVPVTTDCNRAIREDGLRLMLFDARVRFSYLPHTKIIKKREKEAGGGGGNKEQHISMTTKLIPSSRGVMREIVIRLVPGRGGRGRLQTSTRRRKGLYF